MGRRSRGPRARFWSEFRAPELAIESLEERKLPATIISVDDIAGPVPPATGDGPYGVQLLGGAGQQVAVLTSTISQTGKDDYLTTTNNGTAYLVFGSRAVSATFPAGTPANSNQDYLKLNNLQRSGTISNVGNDPQTNPVLNQQGYPFAGIEITDSGITGNNVRVSVATAGHMDGDGYGDFLIGFVSTNANGDSVGRAYLVYGDPLLLTLQGQGLDLSNPPSGLKIVRFTSDSDDASVGYSVGALQNFFGDGQPDVVIGAPTFSLSNARTRTGAVYVIGQSSLNPSVTQVQNFNLSDIGTTPSIAGVVFVGTSTLARAGASVAPAGDVDKTVGVSGKQDDLLIGSPGISTAYLIYGSQNLRAQATTIGNTSVVGIDLSRVGSTNDVSGASFTGEIGDGTGYSVSTAGDFDGDGISDILIGSPFYGIFNPGRVTLIYGASATSGLINDHFDLDSLPSTIRSIQYLGGSELGLSLTAIGKLAAPGTTSTGTKAQDALDDIVLGSSGSVFVILGTTTLPSAPVSASSAADLIIRGNDILGRFGATVAARRFPLNTITNVTIDGDRLPDFVVGAPGIGTYVFEGALLYPNISSQGGVLLPSRGKSAQPKTELILGEQPVPTVETLSTLLYKAIPSSVALPTYRPQDAFATRLARFSGLVKTSKKNGTKYYNQPSRGNTLGYGVFSRGRFPVGQVRFKSPIIGGNTIPANLNK